MTAPPVMAGNLHPRLEGRWRQCLIDHGVPPEALMNRHGPCPACGGTDRFRYDDRYKRGDFFCNACGAGDGFTLLQRVHHWTFAEARRAVLSWLVIDRPTITRRDPPSPRARGGDEIARPTPRVREILRTSARPSDVPDVVTYLRSRHLWPLLPECTLRAHVGLDYFERGDGTARILIGRFPALVASVSDVAGERVTAHVTYLKNGAKLTEHEPRKILSPMTGRRGCAVRLVPLVSTTLGIAEGIETALAAMALHGVPVWAALNAPLLAKFDPPGNVERVVVFADNDVPGLDAATRLRERLADRVVIEISVPPIVSGDWCDVLAARMAGILRDRERRGSGVAGSTVPRSHGASGEARNDA